MSSAGGTYFVGPDEMPDKYKLVCQFGAGGEAQLWKATLRLAGDVEPVAVKVLRLERMDHFETLSARWAEQAEVLRFVRHPGVVGIREHFEGPQVHLAGTADDSRGRSLYLVMNWVEGHSVRDWVFLNPGREGMLRGLRHLEQVAEVLDLLHTKEAIPSGRAIVHGDLSPGNVMIDGRGQALLVDLGLVRIAGHQTVHSAGTPGYAAPEVWQYGSYTPAADRYGFGAVAYFMMTGDDPDPDPKLAMAALAKLPLIAGAAEKRVKMVTSIFSVEPQLRPSAVEWISALRSGATTTARTFAIAPETVPDRAHEETVVRETPQSNLYQDPLPVSEILRRPMFIGVAALAVLVGFIFWLNAFGVGVDTPPDAGATGTLEQPAASSTTDTATTMPTAMAPTTSNPPATTTVAQVPTFSEQEATVALTGGAEQILLRYNQPQYGGDNPDFAPEHESPTSYQVMLRGGVSGPTGNKKWNIATSTAELNRPDVLDPSAVSEIAVIVQRRQVPSSYDPQYYGDSTVDHIVLRRVSPSRFQVERSNSSQLTSDVYDNTDPNDNAAFDAALMELTRLISTNLGS